MASPARSKGPPPPLALEGRHTSLGPKWNACDSEGLPEDMQGPEDTLEHVGAFACSSVQGWRPGMEDAHIGVQPLTQGDEPAHFFAVFDGHGGHRCSRYLKEHLPVAIRSNLETHTSREEALKRAFCTVDAEYVTSEGDSTQDEGSTAVTVLVVGRTIYCANTGDSRAVLVGKTETKMLSVDHKPSMPAEKERIVAAGGLVWQNRVMGYLAVARAFGDKSLKTFVIPDPDVVSMDLQDDDEFVVLACDGLWDVADNDMVSALVRRHTAEKGLKLAAQALTTYAIRNGSKDNVTCMIVALQHGSVALDTGAVS
eukprot:Tamp_10138.p1 GENE.Tamp_10138~~Tamp_10138.p1  ORF type:complete len:356 (-),score=70.73 Tamp_10138:1010-1945(-)